MYTVGYEGLDLEGLAALLQAHGIETLVDVRQRLSSRKPGFSRAALAAAATARGIRYVHLRALGCPDAIRYAYRADRDWTRYTERYRAHLDAQGEALGRLAEMAQEGRCCLLCYEAAPARCHRAYVAERVAQMATPAAQVVHLGRQP